MAEWFKCIICRRKINTTSISMCERCGKAYDRSREKSGDILTLILWVADRVRRVERRRQRIRKS
jgi:hypothetical protein